MAAPSARATLQLCGLESTDDPTAQVRDLQRHREASSLSIVIAPEDQPPASDVWAMCDEGYADDDFDSMDDDFNRNAAYVRAFAAVPVGLTRWVEIGCGASATLTQLALHHGPAELHVTAFEVNAASARSAGDALRRSRHRVHIVTGRSTQPELLRQPARRFDVLVHEVFGSFASSEGCPQMLSHARAHYLARALPRRKSLREFCRSLRSLSKAEFGARRKRDKRERIKVQLGTKSEGSLSIPSRCATFFTPCELRAAQLDACDTVLVDSARTPKVVLVSNAPLDAMALCRASGALEYYDFNRRGSPLRTVSIRTQRGSLPSRGLLESHSPTPASLLLPLSSSHLPLSSSQVQSRESLFTFEHDGVCNCLGVFLWVDLGLGGPSKEASAVPCTDGGGGGGGERFQSRFPFGASALGRGEGSERLNDFTSLCTPETCANRTHATNWLNPLLLLPTPVRVLAGERLCVRTCAAADSTTPSFSFEVELLRTCPAGGGAAARTSLGTLTVGFSDLYPDYGTGGADGEEDDDESESESDG